MQKQKIGTDLFQFCSKKIGTTCAFPITFSQKYLQYILRFVFAGAQFFFFFFFFSFSFFFFFPQLSTRALNVLGNVRLIFFHAMNFGSSEHSEEKVYEVYTLSGLSWSTASFGTGAASYKWSW